MPTKTKPKPPAPVAVPPVVLRKPHRGTIWECLNIDSGVNRERAENAITTIELQLTNHKRRMWSAIARPLPAHIVAAIAPMVRKAEELAALVHPGHLHHAVLRELGLEAVSDGAAWNLLKAIELKGHAALERLKGERTSGRHVEEAGRA